MRTEKNNVVKITTELVIDYYNTLSDACANQRSEKGDPSAVGVPSGRSTPAPSLPLSKLAPYIQQRSDSFLLKLHRQLTVSLLAVVTSKQLGHAGCLLFRSIGVSSRIRRALSIIDTERK